MMLRDFAGCLVVAVASFASPVQAADTWSCDYEENTSKNDIRNSIYEVVGYQLMETTVHVTDEYMVLENSNSTIVAAKAARFTRDEKVGVFQVMIDKATGDYLKTITTFAGPSRKQTGKCKLVRSKD